MITVSKEQLSTVEYILEQSTLGNHVLFAPQSVSLAFQASKKPMTEAEAYEVEHYIEKIISFETLEQQKAFIDQLPQAVLFRVIKTYFNIVENNLFESSDLRH